MFRELGYGVMFYLSSMVGAIVCGILWSAHTSHGPEEHTQWLVEGAIGGAILGGGCWLWYKYSVGYHPAIGCFMVMFISAVIGMIAFLLSQRSIEEDNPGWLNVVIGTVAAVLSAVALVPLLPRRPKQHASTDSRP